MCNRLLCLFVSFAVGLFAFAQADGPALSDTLSTQNLDDVTITARSGTRRLNVASNTVQIGRAELFKAACCNLGESFTTNPSVDVNYSDAATGAKQIRLLGLSGTYVQMLTENIPNLRGLALPYALDFVPGPWMSSIAVSKGASSVKNGYESITGQIDIEYLKPDDDEGVTVNLYGGSLGRLEANADANLHLADRLSTELLAHHQSDVGHHDVNGDGFLDQPNVQQWNLQNRWKYRNDSYLFHGGLALVKETRQGGQLFPHDAPAISRPYLINLATNRYEGYMKHAFILDADRGTNVALIGTASVHRLLAGYGLKAYDAVDRTAYAQLMFETNLTPGQNLSAGLSLAYDDIRQQASFPLAQPIERETTPGIYAQYTFNHNDKVVLMAGVRADHSSLYGTFVTPRLHLRLSPGDIVSLRLSAGKGYRTVHALAENNYLLASGRTLVVGDLRQEQAWNYGTSSAFYIPLADETLKLNVEYYHTRFIGQAVIDYDTDPTQIRISPLGNGEKSYSNTFQVDATCPVLPGLELTAAWRLNDVKCTYGGQLMQKPLTSRYKCLVTATYKTPLELWQFDATLQRVGGGRMPTPVSGLWDERFPSYNQLSAQVTRWFRHFSVYAGGENLTGFRQQQPIISADDPWSDTFDPTLVWGPVHGAMFYAGIRINIGRL